MNTRMICRMLKASPGTVCIKNTHVKSTAAYMYIHKHIHEYMHRMSKVLLGTVCIVDTMILVSWTQTQDRFTTPGRWDI
jgi:hypothetical protein